MQTHTHIQWNRWERRLLWTFLAGRLWLFVSRVGEALGFDADKHLEMVRLLTWSHQSADLHAIFYGYHPPIAFLFARIPMTFGLSDLASVHIVSALSSLVAFFFMRATLHHLRLLGDPLAVAFLYIAASLPMQIFLASSINMESILLAEASATLYCSVRAFWDPDPDAPHRRTFAVGIVASIALAMLTKFNGLLFVAIPLLAAWVRGGRGRTRRVSAAAALGSLAILLVFPYYLTRYYIPEGTFFPSNTNTFDADPQRDARERRDDNPAGFFTSLFSATEAHRTSPEPRDLETLRLSDTWKDFWVRDLWLGVAPEPSRTISIVEYTLAPFLLLVGAAVFLRTARRKTPWLQLGAVFAGIGLLHLAALIAYAYQNPWAGSVTAKGIYIAPLAWLIGYLLAHALPLRRFAFESFLMALGFVAVNHFLLIY
jgi:hypothetical protein